MLLTKTLAFAVQALEINSIMPSVSRNKSISGAALPVIPGAVCISL